MTVRKPHFAGSWYPDSDEQCLTDFATYDAACVDHGLQGALSGGIVPHAGWVFSGAIAYNVVREVARGRPGAQTVVLFGGHLGPGSPAEVMTRGEFWTPLGAIPTDEELADALAARFELAQEDPARPGRDNTVELQAPMIRHLLPDARLVVVKAPPAAATLELARGVVQLAQDLGRELVVLGSTDLTHYGPNYGWAPHGRGDRAEQWVRDENDRRWTDLACQLDTGAVMQEALAHHNACCPGAAAAALECGRAMGATRAELLVHALSCDIAPGESFVGYAGIVF